MIYVGIDPGLTGAVAMIFPSGLLSIRDLPVMTNVKAAKNGRKRNHLNAAELAAYLHQCPLEEMAVFVEYTQAGMKGALANYSLGHSSGVIMGVLSALRLPYEMVRPQEWKKEFGLLKTQKEASRTYAQQLFPSAELWRKKDDGRAEALLIAEWGRRQRTRKIN